MGIFDSLFGRTETVDNRTSGQRQLAQYLEQLLGANAGSFQGAFNSLDDATNDAEDAQAVRDEYIRKYLQSIGEYEAGGESLVRAMADRLGASATSSARSAVRTTAARNPQARSVATAGQDLAAENAGARARNDYLGQQMTVGQRLDMMNKANAAAVGAATQMGTSMSAPYALQTLGAFNNLGGMINSQQGTQQQRTPGIFESIAPIIPNLIAPGAGAGSRPPVVIDSGRMARGLSAGFRGY